MSLFQTQLIAQASQKEEVIDFLKYAQEQDIPFAETAGSDAAFGAYVSSLLSVIMVIAAILVLLYLVWGAIEWITSEGDKGKAEKARGKITSAIIGIIVLSAVLAIFTLVQTFLGINVFNINTGGAKTESSSGTTLPFINNRPTGSAGGFQE